MPGADVVVAVALPKTAPPVVPVDLSIVPVHFAPIGQHAMLRELSSVHLDPTVQQAPPSAAASVEQELYDTGQLSSLFFNSCLSDIKETFERSNGSSSSGKSNGASIGRNADVVGRRKRESGRRSSCMVLSFVGEECTFHNRW